MLYKERFKYNINLIFNSLLAFTLSKAIIRLAATWKSKGASKKSALKRGGNAEERIENPYNIKDLIDNSNAYKELVVKSS
jgi:hypothetical protein